MNEETFPCAAGCGATIKNFPRRKTRLCQACVRVENGRHPSKVVKSRAAMKAHMADPVRKRAHLAAAHEGFRQKLATDPALRARCSARCKEMGLSLMGHAAQPPGSDARRRAVLSRQQTLLGWCPIEYRDEYQHLVNSKTLPAKEARAVIEGQIAADLERYRRTGQLQRVAAA